MGLVRQKIKRIATTALPRRMLIDRGPSPRARAAIGGRSGQPASEIALTFDDGPHPEHTPRLLDLLAQHQIHATFFVLGNMARSHLDLVRRIVAGGHDIGNHTDTHVSLEHASPQLLRREVGATRALLEDLTGSACPLFRPPWGKVSARALLQLWSDRHTVVLWSADPRDYAMRSPEPAVAWCAQYRPRSGDIILLHDTSSVAGALVSRLVACTRREDVRFARISQYLT